MRSAIHVAGETHIDLDDHLEHFFCEPRTSVVTGARTIDISRREDITGTGDPTDRSFVLARTAEVLEGEDCYE